MSPALLKLGPAAFQLRALGGKLSLSLCQLRLTCLQLGPGISQLLALRRRLTLDLPKSLLCLKGQRLFFRPRRVSVKIRPQGLSQAGALAAFILSGQRLQPGQQGLGFLRRRLILRQSDLAVSGKQPSAPLKSGVHGLKLRFALLQLGLGRRQPGFLLCQPRRSLVILRLPLGQLGFRLIQAADAVVDFLAGVVQLLPALGDLPVEVRLVLVVFPLALVQLRLGVVHGGFGFVVDFVVPSLFPMSGQLLQLVSFGLHPILVFVLIKRQSPNVFVGQKHVGINLISKGLLRQIKKRADRAVAQAAGPSFKIDIQRGLDHPHHREFLDF